MDVVGLAQIGVDNAVATLGTAATDANVQQAAAARPTSVVFCFDRDRPATRRLARLEASLEHLADDKIVGFSCCPATRTRTVRPRPRHGGLRAPDRAADHA